MINVLTVTNHRGESIAIDLRRPDITGLCVADINGISPAEVTINTTELASADGALFNSAKMSSRNIVLTLRFVTTSFETIEEVRHKTYKYFPSKKLINLHFETDTRNLEIEGYVEKNDIQVFSSEEAAQISIICPDPYFYSAGRTGMTVTEFSDIDAKFEFPFSNESLSEPTIEMANIDIRGEKVITNNGDADVGITITIHAFGPAKNIIIYNRTANQFIKINSAMLELLTGHGIVKGDTININTNRTKKSITLLRGGLTMNILNAFAFGSNWLTLAQGDNKFAFTADEGSENIHVTIRNRIVYEGV